jgi:hypothetical protein
MARMTDKLRFAVSTAPQPWLQMPGVRADLIRHDAQPTHPKVSSAGSGATTSACRWPDAHARDAQGARSLHPPRREN